MNSHFISKRVAHQLGIAGFIPFGVLSFACWFADAEWLGVFIRSQFAWSILILSFLGGIHWGATLASSEVTGAQTKKTLLWSVVPALIAWLATMIGGFGFALLIISFIGAYLIDKRLYRWYRLPDWFIHLRFILTCAVIVALMLTVIAANFRG